MRIARALLNYRTKEKIAMANNPNASPFPKKFPMQPERKPCFGQSSQSSYSKILPLFRPKSSSRSRPESPAAADGASQSPFWPIESSNSRSRFPAAEAAPYVPVGHYRMPCHSMAPPVTVRSSIPVFSAPPLPPPSGRTQQLPPLLSNPPSVRMASPVRIRPASPHFAPSGPAQRPRPVMSVQMKDVQHKAIRESMSSVIPVQVKDAQQRPTKESPSSAMTVQMKDVQPQPAKEPLSEGKDAPPAATGPPVKIEAPDQVKEASEVVTSEVVPCPAAAAASSASTSTSEYSAVTSSQSGADDDADKGEEAREDVLETEAALEEGIIKLLEIK
ncbi:hypothetical protein CFC21_001664 [Triticum aestivum]|uniref:Uncharacterized protein n=2 Tax=Triticum TaxID=4564 RepID=A0A9R0UXF9_TRITD|nr:hypothetical protein CFC21_001664 [Triticum aestivum]VAH04418.1 unnamed protein product [Triticum turgidum subsp. durum]